MYEGLTSGMVYTVDGQQNAGLDIIARIETYDGEVVYSANPVQKRVIDRQTNLAVNDILRNVVKLGTGRYAYRNVQLHSRNRAGKPAAADGHYRAGIGQDRDGEPFYQCDFCRPGARFAAWPGKRRCSA